jgi:uncharacterized repeat protein (TIGR01451 family)
MSAIATKLRLSIIALSTLSLCSCRAPSVRFLSNEVDALPVAAQAPSPFDEPTAPSTPAAPSDPFGTTTSEPTAPTPTTSPETVTPGRAAPSPALSEPPTHVMVAPHIAPLAMITPHIRRVPAYVVRQGNVIARSGTACGCSSCGSCSTSPCAPRCATCCSPTPSDELICDGGDAPPVVRVSPEWKVVGLDSSDAVAHFDSLDGRTLVQPSNRVCIYAPRFGAVRVVTRLVADEQVEKIEGATQPLHIARHDDKLPAKVDTQNLQPIGSRANRLPEAFLRREQGGLTSVLVVPRAVQDALLPYENLSIIRAGIFQGTEKAKLIEAVDAAIVWSNVQAPQVEMGLQAAQAYIGAERLQITYTVDLPHCPKLRLVKVASTQMASPGDYVDFTLRFDNVGCEAIGNVVILDDLTTRLEYVPDSQQSSVAATFSTVPNDHGSLVVRWQITNALLPGEGGIVKFRTRVR